MSKPTICLTMIVRNESRVIERCLEAVKPFIDSWAITDTGSDDDTMEIIERVMEGVPGKLYQEPWLNFGHNRTIAFQNAKRHGSYALIFDADDLISVSDGFEWPAMDAQAYEVDILHGGTSYRQQRLLSTKEDWKWVGVLHEYPTMGRLISSPHIPGFRVVGTSDGNRSNRSAQEKFREDALILEEALKESPDDPRYLFYLAQSYRDSGQHLKAIDAYKKRVEVGGWDEETWYSMLQIGILHESTSDSWDDAFLAYIDAYKFRPTRSEPLVAIAKHFRLEDKFHLGYMFAKQAKDIPQPDDRLFIDVACYQWLALDEYAVCCYWLGKHREAVDANITLLQSAPECHRPRIRQNLNFSIKALGGSSAEE
jgi:glycosyltransferase involved in cell wall biosynthesis